MSAPVFQAAGAVVSGTAAVSPAWPTHLKNDVGIMVIECSGDGTQLTPSGWTHFPGSPLAESYDANGSLLHILWKRAESASEASVSTGSSGDHQSASIFTYRGCKITGNPYDAVASSIKTTASTTVTCPSVDTSVKDTAILLIASYPNDASTANFAPFSFSNANLTGIAKRGEGNTTIGNGGGFTVSSGSFAPMGSTGNSTSSSTSLSATNVAFTIALKPPIVTPTNAGTMQSSVGSASLVWPTHITGDLGVLVIETSGADSTLTPSGWTHFTGSPLTDIADATGSKLNVLWKRATSSSEPNVTIADPGDHFVAIIYGVRGAKLVGDPFNAISTSIKTTASTTVTFPDVTTTTDDCLVMLIASRPDDSTTTTNFSGYTNTNLSFVAEFAEAAFSAGNGGGFTVATGQQGAQGAIGESTCTSVVSTTNVNFTIAFPQDVKFSIVSKSTSIGRSNSATLTSLFQATSKSILAERTLGAELRGGPTISVSGISRALERTTSASISFAIASSSKSRFPERTLGAKFTTGLERPVESRSTILENTKGAYLTNKIRSTSRALERTNSATLRSLFYLNADFTGFASVLDATAEEHVPNTGNFTGFAAVLEAYGGAVGEFTGFAAVLDAEAEGTNDIYGEFAGFASVLDATVNEQGNVNANFTGFASVIEAYGGAVGEFSGFASVLSSDVGEIGTTDASFTGFASVLSGTSTERNLINAEFTGFAATGGNDINGSFSGFAAVLSGSAVQEVEGVINVNLNGSATVMNTSTGEVTRYTNFNFMHLITVGGKLYGIRSNGFYEISPDIETDNGDEIVGKVVTKTTDFGTFNRKAVTYCYLNSDTEITVTPTADGLVGHSHKTSFGGRKCHLSRGLKGRYFSFEISGIKQLEGLELLENNSQRRIKN